jgi:hypothetical protein
VIEQVVEGLTNTYNEQQALFKDETEKIKEIDGKVAAIQVDLEDALAGGGMISSAEVKSDEEVEAMAESEIKRIQEKCVPLLSPPLH